MKKLIFFVLSVFILSSCASGNTRRENYIINEFHYKGHSYISFKPTLGYGSTVIHNPNCSCYDKQL